MLNYDLKKRKGKSIYEDLYENLRNDIEAGMLRPGEKLPSKRAMAEYYGNCSISGKNTWDDGIGRSHYRRNRSGVAVWKAIQNISTKCRLCNRNTGIPRANI